LRSTYECIFSYFFFSSRRRHTRFSRDWSSDVCSSDLLRSISSSQIDGTRQWITTPCAHSPIAGASLAWRSSLSSLCFLLSARERSEERRVGKVWRSGEWGHGGWKYSGWMGK